MKKNVKKLIVDKMLTLTNRSLVILFLAVIAMYSTHKTKTVCLNPHS